MKKLLALILILAMVPVISFGEYPLSETEKQYLGGWVMYAELDDKIYHFTLTFTDDMIVVRHAYVIKNGKITTDTTASGEWLGMGGLVLFSLAGVDMKGSIDENGILFTSELGGSVANGVFTKCIDLAYLFK